MSAGAGGLAPERLFDANAIVTAARQSAFEAVYGQATIDLAFIEATNVVWRLSAHQTLMQRGVGRDLLAALDDLRSEIITHDCREIGIVAIYDMAWDCGLTAYDAAYIAAAEQTDLTLVTSDQGIHDHAPEAVLTQYPDEVFGEGGDAE